MAGYLLEQRSRRAYPMSEPDASAASRNPPRPSSPPLDTTPTGAEQRRPWSPSIMHPWSLTFSDEAFEARHTTDAFRASYQVSAYLLAYLLTRVLAYLQHSLTCLLTLLLTYSLTHSLTH